MQRSIKFRAWDVNPETLIGKFIYIDITNGLTPESERALNSLEEFQEYTGLTDKNGVEIFEGDIVRNVKTGRVASIKWHGTMASFVYEEPEDGKAHGTNDQWGELFRIFDHSEVIGNVWDNPELLTKEAA